MLFLYKATMWYHVYNCTTELYNISFPFILYTSMHFLYTNFVNVYNDLAYLWPWIYVPACSSYSIHTCQKISQFLSTPMGTSWNDISPEVTDLVGKPGLNCWAGVCWRAEYDVMWLHMVHFAQGVRECCYPVCSSSYKDDMWFHFRGSRSWWHSP